MIEALIPYAERHLEAGGRLNNIARHILGLYHGRPRARAFRRHLSEQAPRAGAGAEVLIEAMAIAEGRLPPRWPPPSRPRPAVPVHDVKEPTPAAERAKRIVPCREAGDKRDHS